jgi:iron(III) transport system substrate-binding protein
MHELSRRRLLALLIAAGLLVAAGFVGVVLATSASSSDELVIYSARSHYGEEEPFRNFAERSGTDLRLRGGSALELYERLRSEGPDTPADVLITVDAANLWRAKEAGLLEPVRSAELEAAVPADLRDAEGAWFGLTVRARTIMRSTERVAPEAVTTYAGLGDPRWKGRLCLRSGTSEYNVSFVADRLAKDGPAATERMLRRWMANEPQIRGSDTDVLDKIADGDCDVGLTNSYYLGRELEEDPGFPVAPIWADQRRRGTHVNISGLGVVGGTDRAADAAALVEFLTAPRAQRLFAENNHEFPVVEGVEGSEEIARLGDFKRDPIDVDRAGARLDDAQRLMDEVGWD